MTNRHKIRDAVSQNIDTDVRFRANGIKQTLHGRQKVYLLSHMFLSNKCSDVARPPSLCIPTINIETVDIEGNIKLFSICC